MSNLREKIFSAGDIEKELVEVKEWGVTLEIRSMTGAQRARVMAHAVDEKGKPDLEKVYPDLLIYTIYDPESGELVFSESDRGELMKKNGAIIERLARVAMRLSGIGEQAVEEAEKNSGSGTLNGGSTSN